MIFKAEDIVVNVIVMFKHSTDTIQLLSFSSLVGHASEPVQEFRIL
jgi:hypothetical protein